MSIEIKVKSEKINGNKNHTLPTFHTHQGLIAAVASMLEEITIIFKNIYCVLTMCLTQFQ